MRRAMVIGGVALTGMLAVTQLVLPPWLEGRVEDRLTRNGGSAKATLEAVPALRLLSSDGSRFELKGRGLTIDLRELEDSQSLSKLDGFSAVELRLVESRAGPFSMSEFALARPREADTYGLSVEGATSAAELSSYAAGQLPGPLASLIAGATRGALGGKPIPFQLDAELESNDGRPRVTEGSGSVAGIPAGPLAVLLASAVVSRL